MYSVTKAGRESQTCTKHGEKSVNIICWLQANTTRRTKCKQTSASRLNQNQEYFVRFEVNTAVTMNVVAFWDMMPWSLTEIHRHFGKMHCLHLQYSPESCVNFSHTTRRRKLAASSLQEYFHLRSSAHGAIKLCRVNMPRSGAVVSLVGRSANKYSDGCNRVDDSPQPRPDRLYSPIIFLSGGNLKSSLG